MHDNILKLETAQAFFSICQDFNWHRVARSLDRR